MYTLKMLYNNLTKFYDEIAVGPGVDEDTLKDNCRAVKLFGYDEPGGKLLSQSYFLASNLRDLQVVLKAQKEYDHVIHVNGAVLKIEYRERNPERSYIVVSTYKVDSVDCAIYEGRRAASFSHKPDRRENQARTCLIYEGEFDVRVSFKRKTSAPATLLSIALMFNAHFLGPINNTAKKSVIEIFKYYQTIHNAERYERYIEMLKRKIALPPKSWWIDTSATVLNQWMFSKDTEMYCRTLGIDQPIPGADKLEPETLTRVCKAAKYLQPDARADFFSYIVPRAQTVLEDEQEMQTNHFAVCQVMIYNWLGTKQAQSDNCLHSDYFELKQKTRTKIPMMTSKSDFEKDYKRTIFTAFNRRRKRIDQVFDILNANPQVQRLDQLIGNYEDDEVKIKRITTSEQFLEILEKYNLSYKMINFEECNLYYEATCNSTHNVHLFIVRTVSKNMMLRFIDFRHVASLGHSSRMYSYISHLDICNQAIKTVNKEYGIECRKKSKKHSGSPLLPI